MSTRVRIVFTDFDTTSEVSGLDGSTYIVVTAQFTMDAGKGPVPARASIGISTRQGRRAYELVEPAWAYRDPLGNAILDYVREAERLFRVSPGSSEHRDLLRTVDLEMDISDLPL